MGNRLFGNDIAGKLAAKLGPKLLPLVLIKVKTGARDAGDPSDGPALTEVSYPCRGMLDTYRDAQYDGTTIKRGDRKALILGDTIAGGNVPEPSDKITAEGNTYLIQNVERDPDAAAYTCHIRGA